MFVISLVIMAVLVAADQLIKLAVTNNLPLNGQPVEVIKFGSFKVFSLTHIRNSGAAWSMMSGKTWFLIGLPVVVLIVAVIYMYKIRKGSKLELVSLAMVLAGGIGNLIDRIRVKEVVDYIKFEPINFPIFNFADICIVIGGILFVICFCFLASEFSLPVIGIPCKGANFDGIDEKKKLIRDDIKVKDEHDKA